MVKQLDSAFIGFLDRFRLERALERALERTLGRALRRALRRALESPLESSFGNCDQKPTSVKVFITGSEL